MTSFAYHKEVDEYLLQIACLNTFDNLVNFLICEANGPDGISARIHLATINQELLISNIPICGKFLEKIICQH